jgi:hypothetical protein
VPDRFFGAQLTQAPARKPAADRKRQCDDLSVEERRQADHDTDRGAGVGTGDEAREVGSLQAQVGGAGVQEQPRDDAGRERDAEKGHKNQPVGPVAALEDEDVPEAPVANEHRGQGGHGRELHDERRQQQLLGREGRALH